MSDIRQQLADMLSEGIYEITLLDPDDLTDDERVAIPDWWFEALAQPSPTAALSRALDEWEATLPGRLPKFLAYAREHGQGIFLGRQILGRGPNTQVVLIYALTDSTGRKPFHCWVGTPPIPAIPQHLQELPSHVKVLHTHLHDAFRWAVKAFGGILPITELDRVSDYTRPGDLRVVNANTEPDLSHIVMIYVAGSSATICAGLSNDTGPATGWIYGGGEIERVDNFWSLLDEWITLRVSRS